MTGATPPERHAADPTDDLVGRILAGRYRIVRKLGVGAMGAVYLGEHLKIGRLDAIKVLRPSVEGEAETVARFLRGARNLSRIRHQNICTIYDFSDADDGLTFLAMEYVTGQTLADLLEREGAMAPDRAVGIAVQAANALDAAHRAGIVHRDVKPGNIMIAPGPDGSDVVKVVDFDIAKARGEDAEGEVTRVGFVIGTPEYMSPEQLMGEPLDGRSDTYSLGVVLFRMLTGLLPFEPGSLRDLISRRLTQPPLRLDDVAPERHLPAELQQVLDRVLAHDASARPASAAGFGRELEDAVAAAAADPPARTGPPAHTGIPAAADPHERTGRHEHPGSSGTADPPGRTGSGAGAAPGSWTEAGAGTLPDTLLSPAGSATSVLPGYARGSAPLPARGPAKRRRLAAAAGAVLILGGFAAVWTFQRQEGPPRQTTAEPATRAEVRADGGSAGPRNTDGQPAGPDRSPSAAAAAAENAAGSLARADPPPMNPSGGAEPGPSGDSRSDAGGAAGADPRGDALSGPLRGAARPLSPDDANAVLWNLFDRVASAEPDVRAATLEAVRDTARTLWDLPGVSARDRAFAAYILGNVFLPLGDPSAGRRWAERAVELCPNCPGYAELLTSYRSQPQ